MFTNFPPILWSLIFHEFTNIGNFAFLRFSLVLETLFFNEFSHVLGTWIVTNFPLYWALCFYETFLVLGTLRFYGFSPCIRNFEFLIFTNLSMHWGLSILRIFLCIGDFYRKKYLRNSRLYWRLWAWTKTILARIGIFFCAGYFKFFNLPVPRKNKLLFCIGYSLTENVKNQSKSKVLYRGPSIY